MSSHSGRDDTVRSLRFDYWRVMIVEIREREGGRGRPSGGTRDLLGIVCVQRFVDGQFLRRPKAEKCGEASGDRGEPHDPDDRGGGGWHDGGDPVRERERQRGGEQPHGELQPVPDARPRLRALVRPDAAEEQEEVGVREGDERGGDGVAAGAVQGHPGAEGEVSEPGGRKPREAPGPGAVRLQRLLFRPGGAGAAAAAHLALRASVFSALARRRVAGHDVGPRGCQHRTHYWWISRFACLGCISSVTSV